MKRKHTFISAVLEEIAKILLEDIDSGIKSIDLNAANGFKFFDKLQSDQKAISDILEKFHQNCISDVILADTIEGLGHLYFYPRFSDIYDYLYEVYQKEKSDKPKSLYELIVGVYKGTAKGQFGIKKILRVIFKDKDLPICWDFNSMADRLYRFSIEYLHGIMLRCEHSICEVIYHTLENRISNDEEEHLIDGVDIEDCKDEGIKRMIEVHNNLRGVVSNSSIYVENTKRGRYGIDQLKKILKDMDSALMESIHGEFLSDGVAMLLARWYDWKKILRRSSLQLFSIIFNTMCENRNYEDFKIPLITPQEYQERLCKKSIWDLILIYTNLYMKASNANLLIEGRPILLDLIELNDFETLFDDIKYHEKYGEIM